MRTYFILLAFFFLKTCDLNEYPRAGGDLAGVYELKKIVNTKTKSTTTPNYTLRLESDQCFQLIKNNRDTLLYIAKPIYISEDKKAYWTILGGQNNKTYEYIEFKFRTPLENGKLNNSLRVCSAMFRDKYDLKNDTLDYYFVRK